MKKLLSFVLALIMLVSIVPFSAFAVGETAYYQDKYLDGLADPSYTKNTEKYDGYHFVVGTKAVWDCKLYTLTAKVTKLAKNIATFEAAFESKIPEPYIELDSGWNGYHIIVNTNVKSYEFYYGDKMQFEVNTAKVDPFSTSCAGGGTQFIEIRIEKDSKEDFFPIYLGNPYYDNIAKNRNIYPENAGYFTEVKLCDTYALAYYVKPTYKLNTNSIGVNQKAIALGKYGFDSIVKYKVRGAKKWAEKNFAKGKKVTISGLKANTIYELQLLCKLPYTDRETGKKMYVIDIVGGKSFSITTSINVKPQLTQVTISKVKYGKKTVKGYWENGNVKWHPAETFNTCSYTMTIKLKNVPKNVKGLYWKQGGAAYYAKGRKGTYTFKLYYQTKKAIKGLKLSANLYYVSNTIGGKAVGFSPARAVSYKLKNSTTKYK